MVLDLFAVLLGVGLGFDWRTRGVPLLALALFVAMVSLKLIVAMPGGYALAFAAGWCVGVCTGLVRWLLLKIELGVGAKLGKFPEARG